MAVQPPVDNNNNTISSSESESEDAVVDAMEDLSLGEESDSDRTTDDEFVEVDPDRTTDGDESDDPDRTIDLLDLSSSLLDSTTEEAESNANNNSCYNIDETVHV